MDVPKETFFAAILHLDGAFSAQCKQGGMNLQTDVFASAKRSTDSAEYESNLFLGKP